MASRTAGPERRRAASSNTPYSYPEYRSSVLRAPQRAPFRIPYGPTETSGPPGAALLDGRKSPFAADLTRQHAGAPLGERIIVHGRLLDAAGNPLPGSLVEIWQANAAGRYAHEGDQHDAPLDPNFTGAGHCLTDADGTFRFVTVKPGAYPWRNHDNAWRPAHIHFSVFGRAFSQRLVTQMYFPGDPLLTLDPIYQSVPDEDVRRSLISTLDISRTVPEWALAYRFDITVGGRQGQGQGEDP